MQNRDRNVEVAADQRAKQQNKGNARPDAQTHIGIAENAKLDQDDQPGEQNHQDRKQSRRQRQVVHLGTHGCGGSVSFGIGVSVTCSIIDFLPHGKSVAECSFNLGPERI